MIKRLLHCTLVSILILGSATLKAQNASNPEDKWGSLTGTAGFDAQYYNKDPKIGAPVVPDKFRMNSFIFLMYKKGGFNAGLRYESYLPKPLLGFDNRWEGQGVAFRWAEYKYKTLQVTAGSFYEQFGNGLILRSYEARALGFDNFIDGFRVKYSVKGIHIKGLIGKKRFFWTRTFDIPSTIRGLDAEINFNEMFPKMEKTKVNLIIGGSFVSRYQQGGTIQVGNNFQAILPENVAAYSGRANLSIGKFSLIGEFAWKINDPTAVNRYIYKSGNATLLTANFSTTNFGMSLGAKRVDNMAFYSDRTGNAPVQFINWIPMLNKQHTYTLPATIYPYAVQYNGENGLQADINFTVPRGSKLGGKYGIDVNINGSVVYGLDTTARTGLYGYHSKAFGFGNLFYRDINVELSKKFNKKWKLNLMLMNLYANLDVVQVSTLGKDRFVNAYIGVTDLTWRINTSHAIRVEFQTLYTKQDQGSWMMNLIEYTYAPNWFVSFMNQFNYGHPDPAKRLHYPMVAGGYNMGNHRFQLSYGRQRAGILCIGGVCRNVPAANGLTVSYIGSF